MEEMPEELLSTILVFRSWDKMKPEMVEKAKKQTPKIDTYYSWYDVYGDVGRLLVYALWSVSRQQFIKLKYPYQKHYNEEYDEYFFRYREIKLTQKSEK